MELFKPQSAAAFLKRLHRYTSALPVQRTFNTQYHLETPQAIFICELLQMRGNKAPSIAVGAHVTKKPFFAHKHCAPREIVTVRSRNHMHMFVLEPSHWRANAQVY